MDDHRFDAFARTMGTTRGRRGALSLLAAAAGLGLANTAARRRTGKRKEPRPSEVSAVCLAAGSEACPPERAKPGAVLMDCHFAYADLSGRRLNATNLTRASLVNASLSGANLSGANLTDACLEGADLSGARLNGANLNGADLTGANLRGADLRGSNAKAAQLATAQVGCTTRLPNGRPGTCPAGTACFDGSCVTMQGTCPTGRNLCTDLGTAQCNGNRFCSCFVSTEGDTRCAHNDGSDGTGSCEQCRSSADCTALFPDIPGVFCVLTTGTACCGGDPFGFCLGPCPTL